MTVKQVGRFITLLKLFAAVGFAISAVLHFIHGESELGFLAIIAAFVADISANTEPE